MKSLTIRDKTVSFARRLKVNKPQVEDDVMIKIVAPSELYKQMWLDLPKVILLHQWLGQVIKEMQKLKTE